METADKIRELREQTGMTRKDFAVHVGIPLRTVEDWEAGRRRPPEYIPRLMSYQLKYEELIKKAEGGKDRSEIVIFETEDNEVKLPVTIEDETVWLNQNQMIELFGREKDDSFKGSIGNIYQSFGGVDIYESLEEKAELFVDGKKKIEDSTLVALTIMIAESRPEEKEMMVSVVMNCML